jgi:hypothetical protein
MKRLTLIPVLVLAFVAVSPSHARAQVQGTHQGFFLSPFIGFAQNDAYYNSDNPNVNNVDLGGPGAMAGVDIGGSVAQNLIVYGELFASDTESPDFNYPNGMVVNNGNVSMSFQGLGAGVRYYFEPLNLFIGGGLNFMDFKLSNDTGASVVTNTSDFGIGLRAAVGKEWWVSNNWGIGVAGELFYGEMDDPPISNQTSVSATAIGIVFTASYH